MEPPTALLPTGFILLLIAGGRLYSCLVLVAVEHSGGRNDRTRVQRPPPSAMWPAVLDGRRPEGRRTATRWFDLSVMPEW
ncbi:MAG: hypothetical protein J0H74_36830 [Chitinophagaceae bacterium]|nr:hypothetical protein [Chitinophagaceae bacterium]